jgi:hypothetical protein
MIGGQKLPIERPRVRRAAGGGEVPLETYAQLQSPDAFPQAVLRRMVRCVNTRKYWEGLEETLTVLRLGVPGALRRTLATTHPIESALRVTRRVTARVTRWRDGAMRRRWCVAGLLRAEAKCRRVKGHRALPALLKTLEAVVRGDRVEPGGPLCENARRNHTSAPRAEAPPRQRERL